MAIFLKPLFGNLFGNLRLRVGKDGNGWKEVTGGDSACQKCRFGLSYVDFISCMLLKT